MAETSGEDRAWEMLEKLDPADVCRRAQCAPDPATGGYLLSVFGHQVRAAPASRTLASDSPDVAMLLERCAYLSRISVIYYLVHAKPLPQSGRLVKPEETAAGNIYWNGSHTLPLAPLAQAYGSDLPGFMGRAARFGGAPVSHGDAAVEFRPFPRMPMTLILWRGDDEFPPRASLLFDSVCDRHVPPDILWSTAMLPLLAMLRR